MAEFRTCNSGCLRDPKRSFRIHNELVGEDENIVCLQLRIVDHCCNGHSRNIKFPFDIQEDTPVTVMREMQVTAVELQISEQEVLSASLMIMEKIWALQSAGVAKRSGAPSTVQLQPQVQCQRVVDRDNNDLLPSCSSSSSGSSASRSDKSQDQCFATSKKSGSKVVMIKSGAFQYTQSDIDLAFSEVNVRDLVSSAKLTRLKQVHKQELQDMQQRHTQQYLDLQSRRLQRCSTNCAQPLWCS